MTRGLTGRSRLLLPVGGVVAATAVLFAVGAVFQLHARGESQATRMVEHTHEVIEELLRASAALGRAQPPARDDAAAAAHDEAAFVDVLLALDEAGAAGGRVRALTVDNPIQQTRIARFADAVRRRRELVEGRRAAARGGRDPGSTPEARRLSTELLEGLDEMTDTERDLLRLRATARARATARLRLLLDAGLGGSALLIVTAAGLLLAQTRVRRRAEHEAAAKHALLQAIIEATNDAVFAKDLAGRYLLINTAGARLLDLTPAEMIGKDDSELLSPDTGAGIMSRDREILRSGQMGTFEQVATSKGVRRIYLTTKGPHRDASGRVVGLTGISRDITERRREEESRLGAMNLQLRLSELLQACRSVDEAYEVIGKAAPKFFGQQTGALYVFHASRDHLQAHVHWGDAGKLLAEHPFAPDDCWALRRGRAHAHDGSGMGTACAHVADESVVASLCVPLLAHGEILGILHLRAGVPIDEPACQRASVVAEQIGMALSNLQLREKLRDQSIRDPLTGMFNRRYAEETLIREIHRAERSVQSLGVLAIDIDHFKRFNDTFGHEVGDQVLCELASLLGRSIRGGDVVSRTGGEEILVILPEAQLEGTRRRAEQIRASVGELEMKHLGRSIGPITVSIGVAIFPEDGRFPAELLRVADAALYRAKAEGRNRVVHATTSALVS